MKRVWTVTALSLVLLAVACTNGGSNPGSNPGSGASSGAPVKVVLWHGYTGVEADELKALADQYNKMHPGVQVTPQYSGDSTYGLTKVLAAVASGSYPDITYMYGDYTPRIAQDPISVDLTNVVKSPSWNWNDYFAVSRGVATVNGKVVGIPALVDNLALVYNKTMFNRAGVAYPNPNWTWQDFEAAAVRLSNPSQKVFGFTDIASGTEDTVWRFMPLLWEAGGQVLTPDGKHAAFNSAAGLKALTLLQQLVQKKALYLDDQGAKYMGLFKNNHLAMIWTGPWDLPQLSQSGVPFGVTGLPGDVSHATITGPDNWLVLNNGTARVHAAEDFLKWFTSPQTDLKWILATGTLPIRQSEASLPGYQTYLKKYPGIDQWVQNEKLASNEPMIPIWPKLSPVIGQMIQSVLLGKATPQAALTSAAQQVNQILATGNA